MSTSTHKYIIFAILLIAFAAHIAYAQTYLPLVKGSADVAAAAAPGDTLICTIIEQVDATLTLSCQSQTVPLPTVTDTPIPPTNSPLPTPTDTPVPPTATATFTPPPPPTNTLPPTSTPVLTPVSTPFANAPLCPTHDPTAYHGLWDAQRGCHYNHTHNADPFDPGAVALFGPPAVAWGGQTISYPWETMSSAGMENHLKHEGYKYLVELGLPLQSNRLNWKCCGNYWITDIRLEHHRLGGPADLTVRLHSFYMEVKVCRDTAKTQCGTAKFGGWSDYGILHSPYKTARVLLPEQDGPYPANYNINQDPYRSSRPFNTAASIAAQYGNCRACGRQFTDNNRDIWSLWTTTPFSADGYNKIGGSYTIVHDDWQGIDASNPSRLQVACANCRYNNTEHQPFTLWVVVPSNLDPDRDGFVTYSGYTDKRGNLVQNCTAPGPDCVPLSFDHAPVGTAAWTTPTDNGKDINRWRDFDLSPNGVFWVQYPN